MMGAIISESVGGIVGIRILAWKRQNRQRLAELPGPAFQRVIGCYCARLNRLEEHSAAEGTA